MSVIKTCETDVVSDLTIVAAVVECGGDRIKFPVLRTTDDGAGIKLAAEIIVGGGIVSESDLGKLLRYVADILDDIENYI